MSLSAQQLASIDHANEVSIETSSGTRTIATIIWVVVAGDEVYVRSVQGESGRWYQRALSNPDVSLKVGPDRFAFHAVHVDDQTTIDAVTGALRNKYRPGGSLDRMTRAEVLGTTLRLDPAA